MELLVLDQNFDAVTIADTFESLIWADRYCGYGDFEIYTPVDIKMLNFLQKDYYLWLKESEYVMIIEDRQIVSDVEKGNSLKVTGRSLESILDRRIIWAQTLLEGNLQDGIKKLLDENAIIPSLVDRKIENLVFLASTDPAITSLTVKAQYKVGENLYDVVTKLCEANEIGFKITLIDDNLLVFTLYSGSDRSYDQLSNAYVIFSPKFENIINSNYIESAKPFKNVTLVAGEGEGAARKTVIVELEDSGVGLARKEMFTDATGVSSNTSGGTLTDAVYRAQLNQKGLEDLAVNAFVRSFEGQVETSNIFKYGEDFFMGDIVQIVNEYGIEAKSRVVEFIRSQSGSGIDMYPTFKTVK